MWGDEIFGSNVTPEYEYIPWCLLRLRIFGLVEAVSHIEKHLILYDLL